MTKYNAKKTQVDNIMFDSQAEANYYVELKILKRAKKIADFDLQPEYVLVEPFSKGGKKYRGIKYRADFLVTDLDGTQRVIDVKGMRTAVYQMKKMLFEDKYPNLTIQEVTR